jgi:aspartate aminotransferase
MLTANVSNRILQTLEVTSTFLQFFSDSSWARRRGEKVISDFVLGNPHEMPLPEFVTSLSQWVKPQNKDWFAYKNNETEPRNVLVASLRERYAMPFESEDIFLTNGAFGAIAVSLMTLVNHGDEVIFISPPWFFYEAMITAYGATPVRVKINPETFDLDVDAIRAAITERTKAIIINSPNNPTGKIYPLQTLQRLSQMLSDSSQHVGHPIYLLSDEAYNRIIYDSRNYPSPTAFYPHSLLLYTYGKTLLTPGQRIGYIALPPTLPGRETLRSALLMSQLVVGYAFPNALLQHALGDLEGFSIDVNHLERKRDRLVKSLQEMGYTLHVPEGTFYLLVHSPLADDLAFTEVLARHDVFVLPGAVFEMPGYFRISLTANDEMIDRSLGGFAAAIQEAQREHGVLV